MIGSLYEWMIDAYFSLRLLIKYSGHSPLTDIWKLLIVAVERKG